MLYTRKGDGGTTKTLRQAKGVRISKASCQTEALGTLDELNSFLGLARVKCGGKDFRLKIKDLRLEEILLRCQQNLFIIQAELAGADKRIIKKKVVEVEGLIDAMERKMPPIKTFFIPGGTEQAALFDVARTLARRAERAVIRAIETGEAALKAPSCAYLNRLSSLLYGMARFTNFKAGIKEEAPRYE